ncbi:MAG: alpha/beta hydrolase [Sandarakinorhabdus sp.]|nr:alpha/beta hydrolase [Sandarakinorhabdus sp.]
MAPPLVFVHGMWSTPATFDRLRAQLEAAGHVTYAPALPWHDRDATLAPAAELGRVTVEGYARFLVAEIEKLAIQGLGPPIIIGHSMGGMLAQIVAARVPHAGLVLLSTAATATTGKPALSTLRTVAKVVTRWGWWRQPTMCDHDQARWGIYNGVPADIADAELALLVWDSGRVLAEMTLPSLSTTHATRVDYSRLTRPALVITGSEDRITVPAISRETARRLAGTVDYHEIAGSGHWLFWGATELRVGALIGEWLGQFATD